MTAQTISTNSLQEECALLKKQVALLSEQVRFQQEQIEWFKRQIFGKRSEKIVPTNTHQLYLEGLEPEVAPAVEKRPVAQHERAKTKRNGQDAIQLPEDLPVERQVIDIPEAQKVCADTGEALVKIGEDITRKLACAPGRYFIKEIVRPKYARPSKEEAGIISAELPESILIRCQADDSFLADILVKKFADHLPLYRQSDCLRREGIKISRQMLCKWVNRVGIALKPLYNAMLAEVLKSGNVFMDETPVDMLKPGTGKTHQAYMWVLVGGQQANPAHRVYNFRHDRSHQHAKELLKGYKGVLHSDKYGAYEAVAKTEEIIRCPCWAHIRRKFFEAESGDSLFREWVLKRIRHLFMYERVAWSRSEEERLRIREQKEAPIIDELIQAVQNKLVNGTILPKSKFKEALGYFMGLVPYLKNYTKHSFSRLDNNVAERAVRPIALGRKNWLFVGADVGGEAAAIILTLVQTCRALEINPREYLEDVMRRLNSYPAKQVHELLPANWKKSNQ